MSSSYCIDTNLVPYSSSIPVLESSSVIVFLFVLMCEKDISEKAETSDCTSLNKRRNVKFLKNIFCASIQLHELNHHKFEHENLS